MSAVGYHPYDLEPSLIEAGTYATRRQVRLDVAAMVNVMTALLYLIPGTLIVPNMSFAGRPALLLAFGLFCWWALTRLNRRLAMSGPQPMRWAAFAYLAGTTASYLAGMLRGLPGTEANAQNFAMLQLLQFLGITLIMADGIPNWTRLKSVLRFFVWCAGYMAVIGIIQSTAKINLAEYLVLPGLEVKGGIIGFSERGSDFFRVASTAAHYIEFSAIMAIAVPFGIHFARFGELKRHRRAAAVCTLLCAAALPMSISRTGVVALGAVLVIMMIQWGWRMRYNIALLTVVVVGGLVVVRPGLLGTVTYMFTGADEDPSISGRTDDYHLVGHWFAQRPILGRGPNTLVPELYQGLVLDNQWLYTVVTQGLVGVAVFAGMHLCAIVLAVIAWRRSERVEDRHLCAALVSAQVVSLLVAATVDSLWFTTFAVTVFLLMGACGAVWRLTHPARHVRTSGVPRPLD
ncbi:O-antigen polymerase [Actinoplanes sp. NBRC 14428]|uniref:O-antigen ligase n=1 Tax=Pseudosporangium ferrugineum TaxID=439699 RepID=A0A2T0SF55_9ACTN|nr:O-antigen ligase family protein [Pseudosporangium ferrugineum]PRY32040.1 O-antigen ligase [Pseudosporangium ferrugineum]BCJ49721.1 O-antigen polymerase [Actinoplanes sp. NBRC 14428]